MTSEERTVGGRRAAERRPREAVMHGEDSAEFEVYREKMLRDLAPAGPRETALAERIVRLWWRLKRAERLQNEVMDHLIAKETSNPLVKLAESLLAEGVDLMGDDPETDPNLAFGRAVAKDFSGDRVLDRLLIYEEQVQDRLYKTMAEFHELQRVRKLGTDKEPHAGG